MNLYIIYLTVDLNKKVIRIVKENNPFFIKGSWIKICIIEIYLLKYFFESHLIYKIRYYRQTNFNQLNIMVPYVDIIGLCHSVVII